MIVYAFTPDGAFVVGDKETGLTSYSYPNSINADSAKKCPEKTATEIAWQENTLANELMAQKFLISRKNDDKRNWERLNKAEEEGTARRIK
jgi:hypothetical protein